jgi:lambda family phage tail tape measure protein
MAAGDDIASLGIKVTSDGVAQGTQGLAGLGKQAAATEKDVEALTASIQSQQKAFAAGGPSSLGPGFKNLGDAAKKAKVEIKGTGDALDEGFHSTTRFKTELAVLAHELSQGNFKRFGGSLLVLAEQGGAAASVFSVLGLSAIAATAALAGYFVLLAEGAHHQKDFEDSLSNTNNYAGLTEQTFNQLAQSIAKSGGTIRGAEETLRALVATGRISSESIGSAAAASQTFQRATGASAEETAKFFAGAANDVYKFASETNQQYHYLSASQLEYIKHLQEAGEEQQALGVTLDALNGHLKKAADNVGSIGKFWREAKAAVSEYLLRIEDLGKTPTVDTALAKIEKRIAAIKAGTSDIGLPEGFGTAGEQDHSAELEDLEQQKKILQNSQKLAKDVADATTRSNKEQDARIKLDVLHDRYLTREQKLVKDIAEARAIAAKADPTGTNQDVQRKLAETIAGMSQRLQKGKLTEEDIVKINISKIQTTFKTVEDSYKNLEAIVAAQHSAGLLSEREFYEDRVEAAKRATDIIIAELETENAEYQRSINSRRGTPKDDAENAKAILNNEKKIADAREKGVAQFQVLGILETARLRSVAAGYASIQFALDDYITKLGIAHNAEVAAQSHGTRANADTSSRNAVIDKFTAERDALETYRKVKDIQGKFGDDEKAEYNVRLMLLQNYQVKALEEWDAYYADLRKAEGEWTNGFKRALENYSEDVGFTARNADHLFTDAFQGMEDALVHFAQTGKLSFSALINTMVADIERLIIKEQLSKAFKAASDGSLVSAITGFFSSGLGNGSGDTAGGSLVGNGLGGGRASGGPVQSGSTYLVGEKGPELLTMGSQSGHVTPNGGFGGGRTNVVIENHGADIQQQSGSDNSGAEFVKFVVRQAKQEMISDVTRGGSFHSTLSRTYGMSRASGAAKMG